MTLATENIPNKRKAVEQCLSSNDYFLIYKM